MTVTAMAKSVLGPMGIELRAVYQGLSAWSLRAALREQDLAELAQSLRRVTPNLRDQYTIGIDETEYLRYWEIKMRGLHAFQVRAALDALVAVDGGGLTLVDIGDSSGQHGEYIRALAPAGKIGRFVSVNLDPVAVEKVRARGGDAIRCRAEELDLEGVRPDLIVSFQTIEHLTDPVRFLHEMATAAAAEYLLITVPYRRRSRFGGAHLRLPEDRMPARMTAEEVHVFELSPDDWALLARFAGWSTVFRRIYRQYPLRSPLRLTAPIWRRLDFEGFVALFLRRDLSVADRYSDW